jgi:hypothetical protein
MDKIAKDFKDKDVVFYMLYTREPHAGQIMRKYDFSKKKQTATHKERVEYAKEMLKKESQNRPILIDTFGDKYVQKSLGGGMPNSLIVIDKQGKVALWQRWSKAKALRTKLEEMTSNTAAEPQLLKTPEKPVQKKSGK